jgi:hypothetical protein
LRTLISILARNVEFVKMLILKIAHKSIERVYLLQNWVEAQSYWAILFAKTANAIGLLPEKRDTGNLQANSDIYCTSSQTELPYGSRYRYCREGRPSRSSNLAMSKG